MLKHKSPPHTAETMESSSHLSVPPCLPTLPPSPLTATGDAIPLLPAPMRREPPDGPDPYTEDRFRAQAEAAAGALCPINQHGCYYFSKSEWIFCPMCEWQQGRATAAGKLAIWGRTIEEQDAEMAAGNYIRITRAGLDELFKSCRTYLGPLAGYDWMNACETLDQEFIELTRSQIFNLLMIYRAPMNCLTDEVWAAEQAKWPPRTKAS